MSSIRVLVIVFFAASSVHAVTIDMVTVGNPGNAPDTRYDATGFGSVGYVYQIGKYEVTSGQYTEFLNAVAKDDPNGLYHTAMANPSGQLGADIERTGSSPNFSYSAAADSANQPVNYYSFWDAARFVNWLHNGQPTGPQGPGTTEGGAYHDVGNQALFGRNAGARFFIPTEDEWYKAAYHDKNAGLAANYFDFPTGTNAVPGHDISETTDPGNNANYYIDGYAVSKPYRTAVGEFELSDSPYGTFDQGGNVWEWTETAVGASRGLRGGTWGHASLYLRASYSDNGDPTAENYHLGFRVATVPEPSAVFLIVCGVVAFPTRRRKSVPHNRV
jgi:formylglycine-generating enzyme